MSTLEQVVKVLAGGEYRLIGVDGDLGSGKTTVARFLSRQLKRPCLHLDSFLSKGQGTFVPSIQYDLLREAVLRETDAPVIVEGICLMAVLERLSLRPDYLIYVDPEGRFKDARKNPLLRDEVQRYLARYSPRSRADAVICLEKVIMNASHDVDIAFIKSKTLVSVTLAIGGLLQTIAGVLLLNAGLSEQGGASLKIMGAEVSATGLGGIVLVTSVMWAYFAYLARPKFSSRSETRNTTRADGSSERYEFRSSTQVGAQPEPSSQPQATRDTRASER